MKFKLVTLFLFFIGFFCVISSVNSIDISTCSNLNSAGSTYNLTADILSNSTTSCINISANNVVLDCQGHKVQGNGAAYNGIVISRSSLQNTNSIIKNCVIENWGFSTYKGNILIYQSHNNTFLNFTSNSGKFGVTIYNANYNKFENFSLYNLTAGIYIYNSAYNSFNNFNTYNNTNGISPYACYYNNFTNFNSYNNTYGLYSLTNSWGNKLDNFNITENINSFYLGSADNTFLVSNGNLSNNLNGINVTGPTSSNTFTNLTIENNTNYNVYFYSGSTGNVFYNNFFDNISKIYSNDWPNTVSSFNFSGIGNTYYFGFDSPFCFDAPLNLTCDYFPVYGVGSGAIAPSGALNSIFPAFDFKSILTIIILILGYFLFI